MSSVARDAFVNSRLGDSLVLDYVDAFGQYCFNNPGYAFGTYHLIFGQLPNIRKMQIKRGTGDLLDPRVHTILLAPSAYGKGVGANFVARMSRALGMRYQEADSLTDSALIGSIQKDPRKPGVYEIERGWLDPSHGINILSSTEATMLMNPKPTPHQQNVMTILQKAMNPIGSSDSTITKKIGFGNEITVKPVCSLLLTTYAPINLTDIIIQRGFMQRTYLIVVPARKGDRLKNSMRSIDNLSTPPDTMQDEDDLAMRLKVVDLYYKDKTHLTFTQEANDLLKASTKELYEKTATTSPFLQEKIGEFISRFANLQTKLAFHYACMNLSHEVNAGHVFTAKHETETLFNTALAYLERSIVVPKEYEMSNALMYGRVRTGWEALNKDPASSWKGWVKQRDLVQEIIRATGVSEITADEDVLASIEHGFLTHQRGRAVGDVVRPRDYAEGA